MSNVIKFVKKTFTLGVVSTTMLWSMGANLLLTTPVSAAVCPPLNAGDMIKVAGKPAIYALDGNKNYRYFFDGDVFKSWNSDEAYSKYYVTVTQECFNSLSQPAAAPYHVSYRPGSHVVKYLSSDQLYVVQPGDVLATITTDAAKALYGASFKTKTIGLSEWPYYKKTGAPITEAKAHPGMLVKVDGKTMYVTADNTVREVTASGMTANRYKSAFVHLLTQAAVTGYGTGTQVTAYEAKVSDRVEVTSGAATSPTATTTVTGGALGVALAADNPFAATIVSDGTSNSNSNGAQSMIPVLKLVFTAGSDGDVKVTGLKLKRSGVSADTDIGNMYLYDGETRAAANPGVANNTVTFSNSAGMFTVTKGASKTIVVKLDLKNATASGKTMVFSVQAMGDVTSNSSGVTGSFPLMGNTFTTANVSDLGKLVFSNVSPTAAGTVDPGTTGFEIWRFQAQNTNQDVEVRKLVITLVGSINPGDLKNFSLWSGGAQVGAAVAEMASDKTITFDWSASPYVVTKGQLKLISLKADIVGGTNRTFYASIQNSADAITYDKNYGVFLKTNGTDSFTIVQAGGSSAVSYTINTGSLVVSMPSDAPTGNVPDSATNVTLAKFNFRAYGEDMKISSLSVSSTSNDLAGVLANLRLLVNGSQVGTTISSYTANGSASNTNLTGWGSFGNSFIIKAGTTAVVTIVADLTDSTVAAADTFIVALPVGSSNVQGMVSLTTSNSTASTGNTLTVRAGTVTVVLNGSFGNRNATSPNGTVNASQVKVGSFTIIAGAGESVDVSQIKLKDNTSTCIGTVMQNLSLYNAATGKQLGATYPNPSTSNCGSNTYTFNISPSVLIPSGGQLTVDVYADLKAAYTGGAVLIQVDSVTATGHDTGTDASANSQALALQANYVSGAGTLMVQVDSDTSVATNNLMGLTDQTVAKFKISASSTEAVNITQFIVSARFSSAATGTVRNIRLVDNDTGLTVGSAVGAFNNSVAGTSFATTTYSHATFSGLNFKVNAGTSKVLKLVVDFTSYVDGNFSATGQTVEPAVLGSFAVGSNTFNALTVTGASSGSTLTPTISNVGTVSQYGASVGAYGATTTLYRTKLSTAYGDATPSGAASPGAAQVVMKFVISNMANAGTYDATVNLVNFNFSTTISQAAGLGATRALTVLRDSLTGTTLATTNFATHQTFSSANSGNTALTDANFTDVVVASGASKTFYVTLDTTDAASAKSLSVRIGSSQITWTDGVSTSLTAMGLDLPLSYKTFTY